MGVFQAIERWGNHEEVVFCHDPQVGLKAIIAIHNTTLGPALGGVRMWPYASEQEALTDVLRLSQAMTYKAAASGLNLGGGKAVIIGDPKTQKSEALFRAFGQFVNSLNGRYITAEDVGTDVTDMEHIFMETPWVTGIPKDFGGSGDPSPYTAHGVLMGIKAAVKFHLGRDSLEGLRIAVQGLGHVGYHLVRYLSAEKAHLIVADIDSEKLNRVKQEFPQVQVVSADQILFVECDVLSPCALGGVVREETIDRLNTKIIAGGANNQLWEPWLAVRLAQRGILYAPDYVINAGGLMNVFVELEGYSAERAFEKTKRVYENCWRVFELAKKEQISTLEAANRIAEARLQAIGNLRKRHPGQSHRPFTTLRELMKRG